MKKAFITLASLLGAAVAVAAAPVDDARLRAAAGERGNWLSYGRDYSNQRFSPLAQINRETVAGLAPRWIYQAGVAASFQATPIVADGVMYLAMPFNHVAAIDAATGVELWRYEHKRRSPKMCCGPANRGVAVGYGKVYIGTVDARLIALDAKTGRPVWDIALADDAGPTERREQLADDPFKQLATTGTTGIGVNMAPLVFDGKVIVGITGVGYGLHLESSRPNAPLGAVIGIAGSYGRPGFYAAFDAATGQRVWQFDTVAATGWEGPFRSTTPDGLPLGRDIAREKRELPKFPRAAQHGGGSAWTTPAFDAGTGTLFVGTGNPSPQMDDSSRPGDNLYTVSLVALDARSGRVKWHYQQVPHDVWGYDVASPPVLFELPTPKGPVAAVGQASKTGWFYVHDRASGELLFKSDPYVPQHNLFSPPTAEGVRIAPGAIGGANWSPVSFDPGSGLAYVAASHVPMRYAVKELPATAEKPALRYSSLETIAEPNWGTLSAISTRDAGRIRWQVKTDTPLVGGVLATAGGLVFSGEGNGYLSAFDAATGARLWQFQCGAGVNAPPVSYEVDGVQYLAVAAGGNANFGFRQGGALVVFALPKRR
ncbi:Pyrrolo-quinoline quinone [Rubrivivax sp. A210]|uniref:pyrroloquinoline quinone-dependent dehydrogenase n=1 Tax=Rubrivivax sp. A210 TaxID=2772301 RepID=UPI00191989F1|nr:PQQ-binding-like beta-propeller repeat protein [Rubrivivax sp. A210]CAD5374817.1 Pyrrolo-quinoline quinone [Rubrivivax sp. A210]